MHKTFEHYTNLWTRVRNPQAGKPLANNTRLFRRDEDCFAIRLHDTDVVTLFADGRIVLSTGGWYTMTTKDRLSSFAPVTVTSDKGVWYVTHRKAEARAAWRVIRESGIDQRFVTRTSGGVPFLTSYNVEDATDEDRALVDAVTRQIWDAREAERVPFFDGIMFGPGGAVLNGVTAARWKQYLAERAAMQKRIQAYCTGYNRALAAGMPMPSGGDCWYCLMPATLGDSSSHDHLLAHMEERYYVPSLAVNALRAKGYRDAAIFVFLAMKPEQEIMGGEGFRANDGSMGGNLVRRAIRDYLSDRLLPEPPTHDPQTDKRPLRADRSTGLQKGCW